MSQDPGDGGSHPQAGGGQRAAQMQVRDAELCRHSFIFNQMHHYPYLYSFENQCLSHRMQR